MTLSFDVEECEELLCQAKPSLFISFATVLAKQADKGDLLETKRKAYGLLADVCALSFQPDNATNPLEPAVQLSDGRTSFSIDHLAEEDLLFFESIVGTLHNARLRARLADILWLRRFHKPHVFALQAINAYLETPLTASNWREEKIDDLWMRGCIIACQIGKKNTPFHGKLIAEYLLEQLAKTSPQEATYLLILSGLLVRLRISEKQWSSVFDALTRAATEQHETRAYVKERQVLETAKCWAKDHAPLDSRIAYSFEAEIQQLLPDLVGQHTRAQLLCSQMIFALRKIPEKRRVEFQVEERLTSAHALLARCGEHAAEDLSPLESEPIDISDSIQRAINMFSNLNLSDSLMQFAMLPSCQVEKCRAETLAAIRDFPISSMFPSNTLSSDGRIVSRTGGWIQNPKNEADQQHNDAVLESTMVRYYPQQIVGMVNAYLYPAFSTILEKHRFSSRDAVEIVSQSPLIPPNRRLSFERVLEFGFHGDHFSAMYILAPEIENLIRFHLKSFGIKTTNLSDEGIESEVGMGSLMEHPEVAKCIGKDFAWELKALFCDPIGPNLRNCFAHGLETDRLSNSAVVFYAWWLVYRMIMLLRPIDDNLNRE